MLPFSYIGAGTYTNGAVLRAVNIPLSARPDWFFVKDLTNYGASATAVNPNYAEWFSSMVPGSFLSTGQTNAAQPGAANLFSSRGTINGFTFIDSSNPPLFAKLPSTGIIDATFVVAMANTGSIVVGDFVRITQPTAMLQISGMTFQVTAVTTNVSITLGYMATSGIVLGANATSAQVQKVFLPQYYPRFKWIANITQGVQTKVYFTEQNDFTPGELVDFTIPTPYGMTQLSFLTKQSGGAARVLTVINTALESSIIIDFDTTGFPAFAFPLSGLFVVGASPATCYPAGAGVVPFMGSPTIPLSPPGTNLQAAVDNRNQLYMQIGTSAVGVANATMEWMAFKADFSNLSNA